MTKQKYKRRFTGDDDYSLTECNPKMKNIKNKEALLTILASFMLGTLITIIIFNTIAYQTHQDNQAQTLNETITNATMNGYNLAIYNSLIGNSLFLSGKQDLPYFVMMEDGNLSVNYVSKDEVCK